MGYYRGDYYRGDYYSRYRGDPGLFGSIGKFLGGALSTVGKVASIIPGAGGLVGTVANLAGGALTRVSGGGQPAAQVVAMPGGAVPMMQAQAPAAAAGLRPGQRVTRGRTTIGVSPLGTVGIHTKKSRRMRLTNERALRRAGRRVEGFVKLARKMERSLPHKTVHVERAKFGKR